jgi:hypothetical protein
MTGARSRIDLLQDNLDSIEKALELVREKAGDAGIKEGKVKVQKADDSGGEEEVTVNFKAHLDAIESVIQQAAVMVASGSASTTAEKSDLSDALARITQDDPSDDSLAWLMAVVDQVGNTLGVQYHQGKDTVKVVTYAKAVKSLQDAIHNLSELIAWPEDPTESGTPHYYTPSYVELYQDKNAWLQAMEDVEITKQVKKEKLSPREVTSFKQKFEAFNKAGDNTEDVMGLQKSGAPAPRSAAVKRSATPSRSSTPAPSTTASGKGEFILLASGPNNPQYFAVEVNYLPQSPTKKSGWLPGVGKSKTKKGDVKEKVLFAVQERGNGQVGLIMGVSDQFKKMLQDREQSLLLELNNVLNGRNITPSSELESVIKVALAQYHALEVMYAQTVAEAKRNGNPPPKPDFFMRKAPADSVVYAAIMAILALSNGRKVVTDGMDPTKNIDRFIGIDITNPKELANFASFVNNPEHGFETKMLVSNAQALSNQLHHTRLTGATTPVAAPVTSPPPHKRGVLSAGAGGGTATPAQMAAEALIAAALEEEKDSKMNECALAIQRAIARINPSPIQANEDLLAWISAMIEHPHKEYWKDPIEGDPKDTNSNSAVNQLLEIRAGTTEEGSHTQADLVAIAAQLAAIRGAVLAAAELDAETGSTANALMDSTPMRLAEILGILQEKAKERSEALAKPEEEEEEEQEQEEGPERATQKTNLDQEAADACTSYISVYRAVNYAGEDSLPLVDAQGNLSNKKLEATQKMRALLLEKLNATATTGAVAKWTAKEGSDTPLQNALEKIAALCMPMQVTEERRYEAYHSLISALISSVQYAGNDPDNASAQLLSAIWDTLHEMASKTENLGFAGDNQLREILTQARDHIPSWQAAQDCVDYYNAEAGEGKNSLNETIAGQMRGILLGALGDDLKTKNTNWVESKSSDELTALHTALQVILNNMPNAPSQEQQQALIDALQNTITTKNNLAPSETQKRLNKIQVLGKIGNMFAPLAQAIQNACKGGADAADAPENHQAKALAQALSNIQQKAAEQYREQLRDFYIEKAIDLVESTAMNPQGDTQYFMTGSTMTETDLHLHQASDAIIRGILAHLQIEHPDIQWTERRNEKGNNKPFEDAAALLGVQLEELVTKNKLPGYEYLLGLIQSAIGTANATSPEQYIGDKETGFLNEAIIAVLKEVRTGVQARKDALPPAIIGANDAEGGGNDPIAADDAAAVGFRRNQSERFDRLNDALLGIHDAAQAAADYLRPPQQP